MAVERRKTRTKVVAVIGVLALVVLGFGGYGLFGTGSSSSNSTTTTAPTSTVPSLGGVAITGTTPCPKTDGSTPRASTFQNPPPLCIDPSKQYTATFDTSEGTIVVALDTTKTPNTANNFAVLSLYHYYDGTQIFRTDTSIDIIQGGSPHTQDATDQGPGYNIQDEGSNFQYSAGDLVMARGSGANSAGAQFFFGTGPNVAGLNNSPQEPTGGTYVTFGHVTQGLDVLQKIIGLNVDDPSSGLGGAPSHTVTINSVKITSS
jgi:cyclophilin family peptidyl-prolyl cis-trans isomerase